MTPLEQLIRRDIEAHGPMRLDRYMALCLGHPEHGYYSSRPAIGQEGDFTTAPEVSQMFGEIVGAWLAHMWSEAGRPTPVALVELGPGRGTLPADIWRTFALVPELQAACSLHLVETSRRLRGLQAERLGGLPASWHDTVDTLPDLPLLLVANEFFDALPIRQLVRRGGDWRERHVGIDAGGRLAFEDLERSGPLPALGFDTAAEGDVAEFCEAGAAIAATIGARLAGRGGAALFVDYGYGRPAPGDTLQALRGKRPADPLEAPGEADLTAHVDFAALAQGVRAGGGAAFGPLSQGGFLTALGIGMRAERLRRSGAESADLATALERLTGIGAMGDLFKAMAATPPGHPAPPPFDTGVARRSTSQVDRGGRGTLGGE